MPRSLPLWLTALFLFNFAVAMVPGWPTHGYGHLWLALPVLFWFRNPEHRRRLALYVAGVVLLLLAYPDPDLGFFGWVLLWPYLEARRCDDGASWWRTAFLFGFLRAFAGFHWLGNIFFGAWWGVSVGSAFVFMVCFEGVLRKARFLPFALRAAIGWALFEWVHSWLIGGLPWLFLAYTQYRYLPLIQAADLFGAFGISFVMAYVSCAAFEALRLRRRRVELAVAGVLLAALLAYGLLRTGPRSAAREPGVLMVQSAVSFSMKQSGELTWQEMVAMLERLTDEGLAAHPDTDLIVWPETIHPLPLVETVYPTRFHEHVLGAAQKWKRPVIYGVNSYTDETRYRGFRGHNSAVLVDARGRVGEIYRKQRLVPMGEEFMPRLLFSEERCDVWKDWLVRTLGYPRSSDLEAGEGFVTLDAGPGLRCAMMICFEGLYADLARGAVETGAPDLILHLVNNGWFGRSWEERQCLASWVFRAVETRTPFLSCANAGITCAVAPSGRIYGSVDRVMEEGFLHAWVPVRWPDPVYLRGGHLLLPGVLLAACGVFGLLALSRRRRNP